MRPWARSHLSYANVISTLALFLALGGTTYAATGGNFILGQSNTAGTPTKLASPTTGTSGVLRVVNKSATAAGRGIVASGALGGYGLWASGGKRSLGTAAIDADLERAPGGAVLDPALEVFDRDRWAVAV